MRSFYHCITGFTFVLAGCVNSNPSIPSDYATKLLYTKPATNWNEALPLGNGRIGAMVYGGAKNEIIQLNEATLWSGGPKDWNNPNAKKYLPLIRKATDEGKYQVADSLAKFMQGPYTQSYMPMADLLLSFPGISDSSSYRRSLTLDSAISMVTFKNRDVTHTRICYASHPDQVLVYRHTASKAGSINLTASLKSLLHYSIEIVASNHLVLKGKAPRHVEPQYRWKIKDEDAVQYDDTKNGEGMNFEVHLYLQNTGGVLTTNSTSLTLENADAVTVFISAATSFNTPFKSPGKEGVDPSVNATKWLTDALQKPYAELLANHVSDHAGLFNRLHLYLGPGLNRNLSTDTRLEKMPDEYDPEIASLIYQYSRYMLIASSRPGGQPSHLKYIWNARLRPEWSSNYAINHDAQMNYYPVETSNLSELHLPFLDFIGDIAKNGEKTAAINYGLTGWCAHHNSDIWAQSAPVGDYGEGNAHWANWAMAGPWLSAHVYDHFQFTGDTTYLINKGWPIMKGAAEFCLQWLYEDKDGYLVSSPSVSPENTFVMNDGEPAMVSVSTTGDIALMRELFEHCITVSRLLKTDTAFAARCAAARSKLRPYKISQNGYLQEWENDWPGTDPSHRHLTPLYPVYPGDEFSKMATPELLAAAEKMLDMKTKSNCTWAFGWRAACYARMENGEKAWSNLLEMFQLVPATAKSDSTYGLFPNLFNSNAPWVILNGNSSITATMNEMILQSHQGELLLLPAIPSQWKEGKISGICARGGFELSIEWKDQRLIQAEVLSQLGNRCKIRSKSNLSINSDGKDIKFNTEGDYIIFSTVKGRAYKISYLN